MKKQGANLGVETPILSSLGGRTQFPHAHGWRVRMLAGLDARSCALISGTGEVVSTTSMTEARFHRGEHSGMFWLFGAGILTKNRPLAKALSRFPEVRSLVNNRGFELQDRGPFIFTALCYRPTGQLAYFAASMNATLVNALTTRLVAQTQDGSVEEIEKYFDRLSAGLLSGMDDINNLRKEGKR